MTGGLDRLAERRLRPRGDWCLLASGGPHTSIFFASDTRNGRSCRLPATTREEAQEQVDVLNTVSVTLEA